jgi:hypothetical protein
MSSKVFILRFDIDSHHDMQNGVPHTLDLLSNFQVPAVFFVNMGRLINRREILFGSPKRSFRNAVPKDGSKVGMLQKMGFRQMADLLLRNPEVGRRNVALLEKAVSLGHELGLHGGDNHTTWLRHGGKYATEEIDRLAASSFDAFTRSFGPPQGFTSPGFQFTPAVEAWLVDRHFLYQMDLYGSDERPDLLRCPFSLPVTIIGEHTVPFIEWSDVQGIAEDEQVRAFKSRLTRDYVCMYGHPGYEGLARSALLGKYIRCVLDAGFDCQTPLSCIRALQKAEP